MSLAELDYNTGKLTDVWKEIQELLEEHGPRHNYWLVNHIDVADDFDWSEDTTLRILTDLRNEREAEGKITVEETKGEANQRRKLWILEDDEGETGATGRSSGNN